METVNIRNMVLGDGVPKICIPVIAHTYEELERTLPAISLSRFDLVEFRADFYFEDDEEAFYAIRKAVGERPILYTIRTKEEGGEIEISDDEYAARSLAAAGMADIVDIQLSRLHADGRNAHLHSDLVDRLHAQGTRVLLSWHDFDRTPKKKEILEIMRKMHEEGCDISKAAVMPHSRMDVLELMSASVEMAEDPDRRPFITMAMGSLGKVTRAACAFTGSCITFGTAGAMSAPGQIDANTLGMVLGVL